MVYVPGGSFQVGDGTSTSVQAHFRDGSANSPLTISSENAITLGGTANGNLANNDNVGMLAVDDFSNSVTKTLAAAFPKGFNAFYCMKYEVSQQHWVDFFNTLDNTQKSNRDITDGILNMTGKASDAEVNRNNISWTSGNATLNGGTSGNVACNFLSWMDGAAFSDWACLRPMTELEYEKACRGPLNAVVNEFAWGTTNITWATGITNSGANNEVASNAGANVAYNNQPAVQGPMRVGSFATSTSTREDAGASHYGIMELTGNLWERIVTVGHPTGRNFTGSLHGDGLLTSDGFCDIATWPGFVTNKVTGAAGSGYRGGDWLNTNTTTLRVSDRYSASGIYTERRSRQGFRAVRSAP
jgi:formylglycine-generating enzyme required for sulfatase activity